MKTRASFHPLTLASAFEQFLEVSAFARRTRESYAKDLAPLLAKVGQQPIRALTIDVDDISWPDRSIRLHGKGDRPREMCFSRVVGTLLDK